jgi:FKBP-type peptidyl-prolyl cis-trans isomerase
LKSNENLDELSKTEQAGLNLDTLNEQIEALKAKFDDQVVRTDQQTAEHLQPQKEEENKKRNIEDEKFVKILGNDTLQKRITQYGVEDSRPTNGQMVTISFEAYLHNDDQSKLVDCSDNYSFVLGDGDVISGLDMVVSLMNRDEKCEMIVEARLAYGSLGK